MTHPLTALIAGVPRFCNTSDALMAEDPMGAYVHWHDLIAALEAATPPDLVEAGKVLEGVTPGPWFAKRNSAFWEVNPQREYGQDHIPYTVADVCASEPGNPDGGLQEANARFIAWCREGVPALIALATAQAAQIAGLQDKLAFVQRREIASNTKFDEKWSDAATLRAEVERLRGQVKALCDAVEADDGSDHHYFTISGLAKALRDALEGKA